MEWNPNYRFLYYFLSLVCLFILSSPQLLQAADQTSQMGLLFGLSVPNADNTNPRQLYGIRGSAFVTPSLSLGGYYLVSGKIEGKDGRDFDYSLHGIEGAYHIVSPRGDTFMGLRVGLSKVRTDVSGTKVIHSPDHVGVALGYDYYLTTWMSVGFEGSYVRVKSSESTQTGGQFAEDSFNIISFLLSLQFRL